MTPDLKRLCEAAERTSARDDIELTGEEVEAIVRAVLMALSQPGEDACDYAAEYLMGANYTFAKDGAAMIAEASVAAVCNHILAEPATA